MTPLAWLRSRPRRPKRQPAPAALAATVEHLNTTPANDDTPQPTGFIRFDSVLTEAETEALRAQFTAIVEAATTAGEPLPERLTIHTPARAVDAVIEPVARAPWVPITTEVTRTPEETELIETAFSRGAINCPVCAYRYSHCYCGGNQ
jgi:hypothetical protein